MTKWRVNKIVVNKIAGKSNCDKLKNYGIYLKTYPDADVKSDHNPVVMDLRLKRFTRVKGEKVAKNLDIEKLKNPNTKSQILEETDKGIKIDAKVIT